MSGVVEWNSGPVLKAIHDGTVKTLTLSGLRMVADVQKRMQQSPASGHIYRARGTKGEEHQASAPGEPPAVDLGEYKKQMRWVVSDTKDSQVELKVGVAKGYGPQALALEFGSAKNNLKPRPHFRPAFEAERPRLLAGFRNQKVKR